MGKAKKILVLTTVVVVLLVSATLTASFSAPPDMPKSGVPEAVDEMIANEAKSSGSNYGPVIAVILVFGLIIGGVIIADKILKHMKKIEELEHQLKEKKEKE